MLAQLAQGHRCGRSTLDQDVREKTTHGKLRRGLARAGEDRCQGWWQMPPIRTGWPDQAGLASEERSRSAP